MGLALRRTELLIEAAQLNHRGQSLRGPAVSGQEQYVLLKQQGVTPLPDCPTVTHTGRSARGTFFLLISPDSSLPQFTVLPGRLGVVELTALQPARVG